MAGRLSPADVDLGAGSQRIVLIKDSLACDGHFLLLACVQRALKAGHRVVLAHIRWPETHYMVALKRLGAAPASAQAKGLLSFCDLLGASRGLEAPEDGLRQVYHTLLDAVESAGKVQTAGQLPVVLVVDALSELQPQAADQQEWLQFVMHLRGMPALQEVQAHLVLLVHSDVDNDRLWVAMLQHAAQVTWEVEPLAFAHAASVSGRLTGYWRAGRSHLQHITAPKLLVRSDFQEVYNFRSRDGSVELSMPGSASSLTL